MAFHVKVGNYVGNGSSQAIAGLGFAMNSGSNTFLLIKGAGSTVTQVTTSEMGATKMQNITGQTPRTNKVNSFDADGFTVGNDITTNSNGVTYYYLAMYDDAGTIMKTGTYAGNAVNGRQITVGFPPDLIMNWDDLGDTGVFRSSTMPTDSIIDYGGSTGMLTGRISNINSTGYYVTYRNEVNGTGRNYYWVALANTTAAFNAFSYTGNGVDSRSITGIGMQPDFALVLCYSASYPAIIRFSAEAAGYSLPVTAAAETTNYIEGFVTDGIQVGTAAQTNYTSGYTYEAFALKGAAAGKTGEIKVWNGSSFVPKPLKEYNGTGFVIKPLKYYDGTTLKITQY